MKKVFSLSDVDCPVCAGKIQDGVAALDGVESARVDFLVLKLTVEADEKDFPRLIKSIKKVVRSVEPDCDVEEI